MSGQAAFQRLQTLAQTDNIFKQVMTGVSMGMTDYDDRSCAMNAVAITRYLLRLPTGGNTGGSLPNGQVVPVKGGFWSTLTKTLMKELKNGNLLVIDLLFNKAMGGKGGGDHHYVVFQLDENTIVAAMGWQGLYSFPEWFSQNDGGRFKKAVFEELTQKIENGDTEGVVGLCSFLGTKRGETGGMGIIHHLHQEINGFRVHFESIQKWPLPIA